MNKAGKFLVVEGIDGAGKSTHLPFICQCIKERHGVAAVLTREPGGTPLAESIRQMLLHEPMDGQTEVLLAFAARRDHLMRTIRPALEAGSWVVCDRFTDSTRAYQGGGRGVSLAWIDALAQGVHQGTEPDCVLVFDAPAELAAQRRQARAGEADRFEGQDAEFFQRVRSVYLEKVKVNSHVYQLIDSSQSISDIQHRLKEIISNL